MTDSPNNRLEHDLLAELRRAIGEARDLKSLGDKALQVLCSELGISKAILYAGNGREETMPVLSGCGHWAQGTGGLDAPDPEGPAGGQLEPVFKENIVFIPDLSSSTFLPLYRQGIGGKGMNSLLSVPLRAEDRLQGVLQFFAGDPAALTGDRQTLIVRAAAELAAGLARQSLPDAAPGRGELADGKGELRIPASRMLQLERMAAVGQIAAGVAHEINNPIGYISSNLKVLEAYRSDLAEALKIGDRAIAAEDASRPAAASETREASFSRKDSSPEKILGEMGEAIQDCQEGTRRVRAIIRDLREFSHPESDAPRKFDLHRGLECTLNIVWNQLKYKARVTREFGELPRVVGFPQELNQVFVNLLVNAAQAIKDFGQIRICTWTEADWVYVRVEDNGAGIPAENLDRIFEPFFTTKEVGQGTGLGLAISRRIVEKHGGRLTVESRPGAGTAFTVCLPVAGPCRLKEAS